MRSAELVGVAQPIPRCGEISGISRWGSKVKEHWAGAPNDTVARWSFRRKEKTLRGVPEAPQSCRYCGDVSY